MSETRRTGQDGAQQAAGATIGRVDVLSIVQTAERLKAAAAGATPGPWRVGMPTSRCQLPHFPHGKGQCRYTFDGWFDDPSSISRGVEYGPDDEVSNECVAGRWDYEEGGILRKADAAYIATADPTTVTALADGVMALAGEVERLTAEVDAMLNRNGERIVAAMLRTCLRCRKPFEREDDIYRCVDCGADLHRECAKDHFGTRVWPPTQACAVDEALRDERARAEQAERTAAHWQAEHGRVRSLVTTVMVQREYDEALRWRREFLGLDEYEDDGPNISIEPLPAQLVCFLVVDCMTLREIDAALTATDAEPHAPAPADRDAAIRDALRLLCVDQDHRGAFDRLAEAIGACDGCGGTGIAYDRRPEDDAPLICCGGPQ